MYCSNLIEITTQKIFMLPAHHPIRSISHTFFNGFLGCLHRLKGLIIFSQLHLKLKEVDLQLTALQEGRVSECGKAGTPGVPSCSMIASISQLL